MSRKKTTKLSVRLLKENISLPEQALKDDEKNKLEKIELSDTPEDKALWAGQVYSNPPKWLKFFNDVDRRNMAGFLGAGSGAVLFVRVNAPVTDNEEGADVETPEENSAQKYRWMAVCFGMGYHALKPDTIEPNFGTIVALNTIGEKLIRSIDTKRPEDATLQTRIQNGKQGDIFDFGVDTDRIILHSITGTSDDPDFATRVTGSEGLTMNTVADYDSISEKCQEIYNAYNLDKYKTRFPWYGKIAPVKDPIKTADLDNRMIGIFNEWNEESHLHLSPPEIIDYQVISKFQYAGQYVRDNRRKGEGEFDGLCVQDFLSRMENTDALSLNVLKETTVKIGSDDTDRFFSKWSLYQCIVCEVSDDNSILHILLNGEWYAIDKNFSDNVQERFDGIQEASFVLPPFDDAIDTETKGKKLCLSEGAYNARVAGIGTNYILCDKKNIHFTGEKGAVEFCDLFSVNKAIIHVKMRNSSSTLSHLFMQGYVSAETFRNSEEFRQKIRAAMPLTTTDDRVPETTPDCSEYTVVFGFIQHKQKYLPFFSKIAINAARQMIENMGYDVRILWIDRKLKDEKYGPVNPQQEIEDAEYR